VVQVLPAGTAPVREARSRPQMRLPHAGPPTLGRDIELQVARRTIATTKLAEFYGPPGIGKTALLKDLAHNPGTGWRDGVVHARVGGQPLEDVLQWLFEVFWKTEPAWAPGPLRVREYLRQLRVLVILDDVEFSTAEAAGLADGSGHPTFLIASSEPRLDPTPASAPLRGLPIGAAVSTFERSLGRSLDESERAPVTELVERLACVPALVVEAARLTRDGVCTLSDLAFHPAAVLESRRILPLPEPQRRLLALLVELAPAAVPVDLLETAAGASASDAEALQRAGFAETNSPSYALSRPLTDAERAELPVVACAPFLEHLAEVARRGAIEEDACPAAAAALEWGRRENAVESVVDAARAMDGALARARRTGAWGAAIACGEQAAHECGRAADEAYFLHQQGTRWLCLGEHDRAEEELQRALAIRKRIGDGPGAGATLHNLGALDAARRRKAIGGPGGRSARSWISARPTRWGLAVLALAAGAAAGWAVGSTSTSPTRTITHVGRTVTEAGKTVTRAGNTVTEAGKTVTQPGVTRTVTAGGATRTVTVTGSTVTITGPTTTVAGPTVTSVSTVTVTAAGPASAGTGPANPR